MSGKKLSNNNNKSSTSLAEEELLREELADLRGQLKTLQKEAEKQKAENTKLVQAAQARDRRDVASIKLLVPTFCQDKMNVRSWLVKFKNETAIYDLNDDEKLRQLSSYVDAETVSFVLEHEHLGFARLEDKLIEEYESRNTREFEEIMNRPYEYKLDIEQWVAEKRDAGRKLRLSKEEVRRKINRHLPARYCWIEREDQQI